MTTERTSIVNLKARLSYFLGKARAGHAIEVTAYRKPVARIIGIPEQVPDGFQRLIAEGRVSWGGGAKPRGAAIRLSDAPENLSDIVIEDRGPY